MRNTGEQLVPRPYYVLVGRVGMGNASHLVAELALVDVSKLGFEEQILSTMFLNIRGKHPASYLSERIDTAFRIQPDEHSAQVEDDVLDDFVHNCVQNYCFCAERQRNRAVINKIIAFFDCHYILNV